MTAFEDRKTPVHLWIVGLVSLLWNCLGAFNYIITQIRHPAAMAGLTPEQLAYFDHFPLWSEAAWAFGVWGAMAASILILLRSRHAVTASILSLLGLAGTTLYQFNTPMPPPVPEGTAYIMVPVWIIAIALLVYTLVQRRKGVLR